MSSDIVRDRLLSKHAPGKHGTWQIYGEDPNCDLGGSHHEPMMGTVTGTYKNAVEYAMTLTGFIQWGSGGRVELITASDDVDKLYSSEVRELLEEKIALEKCLKELSEKIDRLIK